MRPPSLPSGPPDAFATPLHAPVAVRALPVAGVYTRRRALIAAIGAAPLVVTLPARGTAPAPASPPLEEVPYVQTPQPVVDAILQLAELRPDDLLVDLGSGDGRIVIEAARRFGVRGLGVEIDPTLVQLSTERARQAGVADRVRFVTQDLFETDLRAATVITMYLLPDVNLALRPRLLALAAGTRLVSHDWDMGDWAPQRSLSVDAPDKPVGLARRSTVHRWTVPARVDGAWQVALDTAHGPQTLMLRVEQRFDLLSIDGEVRGRVDGTRVRLALRFAGRSVMLEGRVEDDRMTGTAQLAAQPSPWRAQRPR